MPAKKTKAKKEANLEESMIEKPKAQDLVSSVGYVVTKYKDTDEFGKEINLKKERVYRLTVDLNSDTVVKKELVVDTSDSFESLNVVKQEAGKLMIEQRNKNNEDQR